MEFWNTLAVSFIGTHKMRIQAKQSKEDAEKVGRKHCEEKGLKYQGTYSDLEIDEAEKKLRVDLYGTA